MKKYIALLFIVVFVISLLFIGIGCKSLKITELEERIEVVEDALAKKPTFNISSGEKEEGPPAINTNIELITVDEAYEIFLNSEDYLFIDVRSEDEFKGSHIKGAIHIDVDEIADRLDEIPDDKLLVVYCNGDNCNRSGKAAAILAENGFDQVYDIGGLGIFEWEEKGYPVIKE